MRIYGVTHPRKFGLRLSFNFIVRVDDYQSNSDGELDTVTYVTVYGSSKSLKHVVSKGQWGVTHRVEVLIRLYFSLLTGP